MPVCDGTRWQKYLLYLLYTVVGETKLPELGPHNPWIFCLNLNVWVILCMKDLHWKTFTVAHRASGWKVSRFIPCSIMERILVTKSLFWATPVLTALDYGIGRKKKNEAASVSTCLSNQKTSKSLLRCGIMTLYLCTETVTILSRGPPNLSNFWFERQFRKDRSNFVLASSTMLFMADSVKLWSPTVCNGVVFANTEKIQLEKKCW